MIADAIPILSDALRISLALYPEFLPLHECPQNGPAAIETAAREKPDVALIDFWLPEVQGPVVAKAILDRVPRCKVILHSWLTGPSQLAEGIASGAVGLVPKDCTVAQLAEVLRATVSGRPILDPSALASVLTSRDEELEEERRRFAALTPREIEVLALMAKGLTTVEIAKTLEIRPKTVSNHIAEIFAKTDSQSQLEVVAKARRCSFLERELPLPIQPRGGSDPAVVNRDSQKGS